MAAPRTSSRCASRARRSARTPSAVRRCGAGADTAGASVGAARRTTRVAPGDSCRTAASTSAWAAVSACRVRVVRLNQLDGHDARATDGYRAGRRKRAPDEWPPSTGRVDHGTPARGKLRQVGRSRNARGVLRFQSGNSTHDRRWLRDGPLHRRAGEHSRAAIGARRARNRRSSPVQARFRSIGRIGRIGRRRLEVPRRGLRILDRRFIYGAQTRAGAGRHARGAGARSGRAVVRSLRSVRPVSAEPPQYRVERHRPVRQREAHEQRLDEELLLAALADARLGVDQQLQHAHEVGGGEVRGVVRAGPLDERAP